MAKFPKSIDFKKLEIYKAQTGFYVYFLLKSGVVVYVGRTEVHPNLRVYSHKKDKDFDSYSFIEVETLQESIESEFWNIAEYEPKYNSMLDWLPANVLNETTFKRIYKLESSDVRKVLRNLPPMFSLLGKYYLVENVANAINKSVEYCLTFKKM